MENQASNEGSLYQKRIPIYPRSVKGKFRNFKWAILAVAYLVYFGLPWLPWERPDAPDQAVLFDLVGRRFFIFDMALYPQDIIALSMALFIAAVTLFFVTTLVGRAFCGYFCFQTIWTDFYIWIEHLVQGERPARIRLHKQPWNFEKIRKYGLTHALWLLASFWTALTFVLYYGYAPELLHKFFTGEMVNAGYITVIALTISTYLAAALLREQVCIYMCPYARFQGVMYEPETLVVTYETKRGEGTKGRHPAVQGARTREERQAQGYGDCIDCEMCVQVCPEGIDIRDGLQYKCISCGLCIDACNTIMDSMGYPRGLVRYDSETNAKSDNPVQPKLDLLRIRTIGYGIFILIMTGILVYNLATRTSFEESVQQVRQPLFVVLTDGEIRNRYQVRITNKTDHEETYVITTKGIPDGALDFGGLTNEVKVRAGKSLMVQVNVKLTPEEAAKTDTFEFIITPKDKPEEAGIRKVRFSSKHEG
jgi:cytochrome c oxidase accessory protein FixG